MATAAVYYPIPVVQKAAVPATANTATDGTGTLTEVARGSASKIRKLERIRCKMLLTNTISSVKFFYSDDAGVTKQYMGLELIAPATTIAAGQGGWEGTAYFEGFALLSDAYRIYVAPYTAHAVNTIAEMFEP